MRIARGCIKLCPSRKDGFRRWKVIDSRKPYEWAGGKNTTQPHRHQPRAYSTYTHHPTNTPRCSAVEQQRFVLSTIVHVSTGAIIFTCSVFLRWQSAAGLLRTNHDDVRHVGDEIFMEAPKATNIPNTPPKRLSCWLPSWGLEFSELNHGLQMISQREI